MAFVNHRVFLSMIQLLAEPMVKFEKDTSDKNSKHFIHFIISIVRNVLVIPGLFFTYFQRLKQA